MLSFLWLFSIGRAAIISSGALEQCVNTGDEPPDCDEKLVVTVSVDNMQGPVESFEAMMDSAVDEDGNEYQLAEPWTISLTKSQVKYRYPITYLQHFNNKPFEEVIWVTWNIFEGGCEDDPNQADATCGWAYTDAGVRVDYSQGYCCQCEMLSGETVRGSDCSTFSPDDQSAHCLRFGELWYAGYEIGNAETFFEITVMLSYVDALGNTVEEQVVVSPESPDVNSHDNALIARLIGDFAPYAQVADYTDWMLFVPDTPNDHERVDLPLDQRVNEYMLIRRESVTLTGRDCDKIGVSYEAFRNQANACNQMTGSCVRDQLDDFHAAGESFLPDFGDGAEVSSVDGVVMMSLLTEDFSTSMVTLTINADDVAFILNNADGEINSCSINDFEAMSSNGTLTCHVENVGHVMAQFTIEVIDCTEGIKPIHYKRYSISPAEVKTVTFDVLAENTLGGENQCTVVLKDALAAVTDELVVEFTTGSVETDQGAQGGNVDANGDVTFSQAPRNCKACGMVDIPCYIMKGCWMSLAKLFMWVILICVCGPCAAKHGIKFLGRMSDGVQEATEGNKERRKKKRQTRYECSSDETESTSDDEERRKKKRKKKKKAKKKKKGSKKKKNKKRLKEYAI